MGLFGARRAASAGRYPWWVLTLSTLGVIAVLGVVITLFFTLGRRPESYQMTQLPAAGTMEFLESIAGTAGVPLRRGGGIRLLNDGAFHDALLPAIRNATRNINFCVYIWEPGRATDEVLAALRERLRAGVQVRVLLDGVGGLRAPGEQMDALRSAGAKVERYRSARLGKLTRIHKRNHRRAIVMDGRLAFTGGAAIADKWLGAARNPEEWRDLMVQVSGPLAATVQSAFVATWAHSTGEILSGPDVFPSFDEPPGSDGDAERHHVGIASAPSSENHPLRLFFFQTIGAARERLYITTPYFVPERATRMAVAERARSGVDVRLLLPNEHSDADMIRLTSRRYYRELLEAGVRIFEFQPTMLHVKSIVVDGIWSVVGSANLDIRSVELNDENVLGVHDREFAAELEAAFLEDLERSHEIRLPEWRQRGLLERVSEWAASRLAEQY
jgi:cardiolipin synthase